MLKLKGKSINNGVVFGKALLFRRDDVIVEKISIPNESIFLELQKFENRKNAVRAQLELLSKQLTSSIKKEAEELISGHMLILDDSTINSGILSAIHREQCNAEYAIYVTYEKYIKRFESMEDPYFRQRVSDIVDIRNRLLDASRSNIIQWINESLEKEKRIIVADDILPTELINFNSSQIAAIILEDGGESGHSSIMARNLDIPMLIQVKGAIKKISDAEFIVVNAIEEEVIISPSEDDLKSLHIIRDNFLSSKNTLHVSKNQILSTADNVPIRLAVNIEWVDELLERDTSYLPEIGLYRTEYMFMKNGTKWSEDAQYADYVRVLSTMKGKPVNIRTIDIGGDKLPVQELSNEVSNFFNEENPFLGCRAIRYSLIHKGMFQAQLKAILRASAHGKVRIILPMISGKEELSQALKELEKAKIILTKKNILFDKEIEVGIMVEVPSAAIVLDTVAEMVDFFTIGTNDLVQYLIAIDRNNPNVRSLYEPLHPAVIRTLKHISEVSTKYGKQLSICGEMGGTPLYIPLLIGLGIRRFSMAMGAIPSVSQIVQKISYDDCADLADTILQQSSSIKSKKMLVEFIKKNAGELVKSGVVRTTT